MTLCDLQVTEIMSNIKQTIIKIIVLKKNKNNKIYIWGLSTKNFQQLLEVHFVHVFVNITYWQMNWDYFALQLMNRNGQMQAMSMGLYNKSGINRPIYCSRYFNNQCVMLAFYI